MWHERTTWYTSGMRWILGLAAVAVLATASVSTATPAAPPAGAACRPTLTDGAGPFGRGLPPRRARIGAGHVLTGVILSELDCRPIAGAAVQFWQSDGKGRYTRASSATVITNRAGRFRFEGPFPASYEGRTPHIHMRVSARLHETLLTRYEPARGSRRGTLRLVLISEAL